MHDVVITGVGLVSAAGEGLDAHLAGIMRRPHVRRTADCVWLDQAPLFSFAKNMRTWQTSGLLVPDVRPSR